MTTYNTGNPIGSVDVKDLYDNAQNLDEAVNTRQAESWNDRLGVARKTWWGMEQDFQQFLIDSGYVNIGDYGPGLEITARNQIFWRDGELYRAGASLELPYTTTGDWGTEEGLFVAVGDQALRQDLVQPVATFNNVADMVASGGLGVGRKVRTLGYYTPGDGGGNDYEIVAGGTATADGGSFIDLDNGMQAKGLFLGDIRIRQFGAKVDGTDDWAAVNACKDYAVSVSKDFYTGPGIIGMSAELDISTAKGVRMIGEGGGFNSGGNFAPATEIRALNAIAGAMIRIRSQQADTFKTTSCGVVGVGINCASLADYGLHLTSINSCNFEDISIRDHLINGLKTDCLDNKLNSGTGDPADGQNNNFDRISVQSATGTCVFISGNEGTASTTGANWSLNRFGQIHLNIRDNNGFVFGFADANTLEMLRVFRPPANTGRGLTFLADNGGQNRHARHNVCYHVQTGVSGIFARAGDGTQPSEDNIVFGFSYGNSGINNPPLIEAGATLSYISPRFLKNIAGQLVAVNGANDVARAQNAKTEIDALGTESLRVSNSTSSHVVLTNGEENWGININAATGDLRIARGSGSGKILLGNDLILSSTTANSASNGTAGAVPANADGYIVATINGIVRKIPFFPV